MATQIPSWSCGCFPGLPTTLHDTTDPHCANTKQVRPRLVYSPRDFANHANSTAIPLRPDSIIASVILSTSKAASPVTGGSRSSRTAVMNC